MTRSARRLGLLAVLPAALLGLSACSSTVSSDDVSSQLEQNVGDQLGANPEVSCPDELAGEVDATTRCEVTTDEGTFGVIATVTSVDGDTASLSYDLEETATDESADAAADESTD